MNNKNIELNNQEFNLLMEAAVVLSHIYGVMGDMVDEKYKKKSKEIDELENTLCNKANDSGLKNIVEEFDGKKVVKMESEWYQDLMEDLDKYEDYCLFSNLSNKLAWRDFQRNFSREEIGKMRKRNGGYFGVDIYDFEKRYYDEFNEHEYNRLEIKE